MSLRFDSKFNKKFTPFSMYILSVLALLIFLYGFFPLKCSSCAKPSGNSEKGFKPRYIDKLAFILIDALRYDFVMSKGDQNYMPFVLRSILKNESCYLITKAHAPTVTLPRLKAMTSGSISTYIDIVLNIMTPTFEEENFIELAASKGLKLVFYGDSTWLKLFPHSFIRSEGTNAFFPYDYFEVDDNITRHIDSELEKDDWDAIFLHYSGLDHIGHTEGPNSPLIRQKLLEMDAIVKKFNDHFKKLEKEKGLNTMIFVTTDHGMKDSGSHGGVTYPEVTIPVVSVGNPCVILSGWQDNEIPLQIDIVPTLSVLLGLPIPSNNMGKIIPHLLHNMQTEDIIRSLETNRVGLNRIFISPNTDSIKTELDTWLLSSPKNKELGINITKKYYQILNGISQQLVSSNSGFKLLFLICGLITLWFCLLYLVYDFVIQLQNLQTSIHWFFIFATILHGVSLFSTSFIEEEHQTWYFFWATFCIFAFLEVLSNAKRKSALDVGSLIWWLALAALHRVLRKLNQTGDKWAFLPDFKFFLLSEEGQPWLFLLFLLSMGMIIFLAFSEGCSTFQLITFIISLLGVVGYRIATGNFKYLTFYPLSRGVSEVLIFWFSTSLLTIQTAYNKTPFYLVWLAFGSLLLRPHNVILLPMQVLASKRLHKFFRKSENPIWNSIAHVWLGNVFYFYQGNGNSLSNVDIAAGFAGINEYNPTYTCITVVAHTFNSYILSYILSPKSDLVFILLRIIPVTLYCTVIIFQLNHLFIWSVFSPKLLYESSITLLFLLLLAFNSFLRFFKSR